MEPGGMLVLLKYEDNAEGNEEPILYFFKDGLDEEKVVSILSFCIHVCMI